MAMILKTRSKTFIIGLLFLLFFVISTPVEAKQKMETTVYMTVRDQQRIPISVNNGYFFYKSSDLGVLQFMPSGEMIAVKRGTVTVTLSYPSGNQMIRTYFRVRVHDKVKNLKWKDTTQKLTVGDTHRFKVRYKADSKKNIKLEWKSDNDKIASVDSKGKVTGHKAGSVTISCSVKGQKKAKIKYKLKVINPTISEIQLNQDNLVMKQGDQFNLDSVLKIEPKNASKKGLVVASDNKQIVTVSDGTLKAKQVGRTFIRISQNDRPDVSAVLRIQVNSNGDVDNLRCIAHRGVCTQAPENTVKAFELAGEAGFYSAESDVRVTKDGQFVIFHDDTLSRLCGDSRRIEDLTFNEVRNIPIIAGNNYYKYKEDRSATTIATLEEYLTVCRQYNMVPQIEIKFPEGNDSLNENNPLYRLYIETKKIMGNEPVMFISFNFNSMVFMNQILKKENDNDCKLYQLSFQVNSVNQIPHYNDIKEMGIGLDIRGLSDDQAVRQIIADGIELNVWDVDDTVKAKKYLTQYGVDLITTNYVLWR